MDVVRRGGPGGGVERCARVLIRCWYDHTLDSGTTLTPVGIMYVNMDGLAVCQTKTYGRFPLKRYDGVNVKDRHLDILQVSLR